MDGSAADWPTGIPLIPEKFLANRLAIRTPQYCTSHTILFSYFRITHTSIKGRTSYQKLGDDAWFRCSVLERLSAERVRYISDLSFGPPPLISNTCIVLWPWSWAVVLILSSSSHRYCVICFSDGADKQRFYEVSCKPGVEGKPCLFMERKLHGHSTCVQRYSYSYAIVREENARHHHGVGVGGQYNSNGGKQTFQSLFPNDNNVWKLDYIKVRSGCACMVQSPKKKQQQKQRRKNGGGSAGGTSGGGKSRSQQ
ncbi:Uncharacterized protein FWK35_00000242 [Aphis craccivora]|uniref:Spaetzle domain-containing protein n=1 Tax=Aphis craccivora TaxID=307492 RepID=A0A6G0ZQX8_APHCR|nr:Uncharacterized protein FWK35_00000242 [Aphis craccivora]